MPPVTSTSVPAAAMIKVVGLLVEDVEQVDLRQKRPSLVSERTTKMLNERDEDPGLPKPTGAEEALFRPASRVPASARCPVVRSVRRRSLRPTGRRTRRRGSPTLCIASPLRAPATSRPARITSTRWGEAEDLLELGRDEEGRHAVGGE